MVSEGAKRVLLKSKWKQKHVFHELQLLITVDIIHYNAHRNKYSYGDNIDLINIY